MKVTVNVFGVMTERAESMFSAAENVPELPNVKLPPVPVKVMADVVPGETIFRFEAPESVVVPVYVLVPIIVTVPPETLKFPALVPPLAINP